MASVGIDLGTTFSCVAVMRNGKVEIVPNRHGNRTTPSCVAFTEQGRLIGEEAVYQLANNPNNTVYDVKRILGRKFQHPTLQTDINNWSFNVFDEDGKPKIKVQYEGSDRQFYPEEISSIVLERMKAIAEDFIGEKVNNVVITVPANFDNGQRRATKEAAKIAELHVLKMINEPTAAAFAYGLERKTKSKRNVVVFDLGGGTFDVTALTIDDGCFKVLATGGDTHLGGQDFNKRLQNHILHELERNTELVGTKSENVKRRLMQECERAKRQLSSTERTSVEIENFIGGHGFKMSITRARFEQLNEDLFRDAMKTVERVLDDAKLQKEKIHDVVLVGGSTRIPYVQELLADYFGKEKISNAINPDESVAYGAAVQAAMLSGDQTLELKALKLLDVTPLSLGIDTDGGLMSVVIKRNTEIPTKICSRYCTAHDDLNAMTIGVYEGEHTQTKWNHFLGAFTLSGLPPLPAGQANVTVWFEIDADGVLHVTARDVTREDNEKRVKITWDKGCFSEEEITRMVNEAKKYRQDDERREKMQKSVSDSQERHANLRIVLEEFTKALQQANLLSRSDRMNK